MTVRRLIWSWVGIRVLFEKRFVVLLRRYRFEYWRRRLGKLGIDTQFYGKVSIFNPHKVFVGKNTTFNVGVVVTAKTECIHIGNHVRISANAMITATGLDTNYIGHPRAHVSEPVYIEDGVWIGSGAQIMPGIIRVGKNSIVAAGSVVTHNVPPLTVVGGIPAKEIRKVEN